MPISPRTALACLLTIASLLISTAGWAAAPSGNPAAPRKTTLQAGEALPRGDSLVSPNGRTEFAFEHDGNLVLYRDNAPKWSSGTAGRDGDYLVMQQDGDLVMFSVDGFYPLPVWSSSSDGFPGARLSVRNEGGAVIRRSGEPILWSVGLPAPDVGLDGAKHIVYGRGDQMVWLVEADGTLFDSYPISGRATDPPPGRYRVFSKSRHTQSRVGSVTMEYMVRFVKRAPGRSIGFHSIPVTRSGVPVQTEEELGQYRSAGCVRQSYDKAEQLYDWTPVGTPVVVLD